MKLLPELFENNRRWAEAIGREDPDFFPALAERQAPAYLWIGCADSRVPANQIVGLKPGQMFVHRNVANVVAHADVNVLSVLQYAVDVLRVRHIIVCGHYGCGGVRAAYEGRSLGLIDHWLRFVRDVYHAHQDEVDAVADDNVRVDRLCELNARAQAAHVTRTTIVQQAWARGQDLAVHAWIYRLRDGLLHDLDLTVTGPDQVPDPYHVRPPA